MADPKIQKIEIHEYAYTLNDLGKDYNGFNLVYEPGSKVHSKGYILRIMTDAGIVGEYAGGSAIDYAALPRFTHYLIGSSALERERIYTDVKRALRQAAAVQPVPCLPTGGEFSYRAKVWNKGTLTEEAERRTRSVHAVNLLARP